MLLPAMVLPLMLTSCDEDRDSNPVLDLSHTSEEFVLNTPAYAANNTYDLVSAEYVTLTCNQPNYGDGVPYAVQYFVQVSLDNNFTDSTKFKELTTAYTSTRMNVEALEVNSAVCDIYQQGNTEIEIPDDLPVYIRLRAMLYSSTDSLGNTYSNSIELPHVHATYQVPLATLPTQMYILGASFNNGAVKVVPPIYGVGGLVANSYYTMVYASAGSTMTWGPSESDQRGYNRITVDDQAGANVSAAADGSIQFGNAGWYTLVFDDAISAGDDGRLTQSTFTMHVYAAEAKVTGAAFGISQESDWDAPAKNMTAPSGSGNWESPAFTGGGELRAYIKIPGYDWWRTEFTLYKGAIYWRLVDIPANWATNVGADYSVGVSAGQKLYVNFDTNTGEVR